MAMLAMFIMMPQNISRVYAQGGELIDYGICGDPDNEDGEQSVMWDLNDEGVLTIFGTGAMADYENYSDIPWNTYKYDNEIVIKQIVIDEDVTSISKNAFSDCRFVTSVDFGAGVTYIPDYAFYNCYCLESITNIENVTGIGRGAFGHCGKLSSFYFSKGFTKLNPHAFVCSGVEEFLVDKDNLSFKSEDGVLFSYDMKTLVLFPPGKVKIIGVYNVPDDVETIGEYAFSSVEIGMVNLSGSLQKIEKEAFAATNLIYMQLPDGVVSIGEGAFSDCYYLRTFIINAEVASNESNVFNHCINLEKIYRTYDGEDSEIDGIPVVKYEEPSEWMSLQLSLINDGIVTLDHDYNVPEDECAIEIPCGVNVTLDLNGYTIDGSNLQNSSTIINVNGELTVIDDSQNQNGNIKFNSDNYETYIFDVKEHGVLNIKGGTFTGLQFGISNSGGTTNMSGGTLSCLETGIFLYGGDVNMSGGTITGSKIGINVFEEGSLNISGSPIIKDNIDGDTFEEKNVFLADKKYITVTGILDENADIGVYLEDNLEDRVIIKDDGKYMITDDDLKHFRCDVKGYDFCKKTDGIYLINPWSNLKNMLENASEDSPIVLDRDYVRTEEDDDLIVPENVNCILDLNGHTINTLCNTDGIYVKGKLTLRDSKVGGTIATKLDGNGLGECGIDIESGTFILEGGTISDFSYGVYNTYGKCTINGGEITSTQYFGVYTRGNENASFELNKGKITNSIGYGVYIMDSTCSMSGGEITGCGNNGLAVFNGSCNMSGGKISGCEDNGLSVYNGLCNISGGTITNNYGGVEFNSTNNDFTISGEPIIIDNFGEDKKPYNINLNAFYPIITEKLGDNAKIGVHFDSIQEDTIVASGTDDYTLSDSDLEKFSFDNLDEDEDGVDDYSVILDKGKAKIVNQLHELLAEINSAGSGDTIILNKDYKAASGNDTFLIPSGKNITIDLNGHTIDGKYYDNYINEIFNVKGSLTIKDSSDDNSGTIKNATHCIEIEESGSLVLEGGTISDSDTNVNIISGTFIMNGGSVIDSEISNVYLYDSDSKFIMNGGIISGSKTFYGIDIGSGGICELRGGTITGNYGGLYVNENLSLTISGSPKVINNKVSENEIKNIYLTNDGVIKISDSLSEDAIIGIYKDNFGIIAKADENYNDGKLPESVINNFESDKDSFEIVLDDAGDLFYARPFTIEINEDEDYIYKGEAIKPDMIVKDADGNEYSEDYYQATFENNINAGKAKVTVTGLGNLVGTASKEFTIKPRPVVVYGIEASEKTYDGKTDAELVYQNADLANKIEKDNLTVTAEGEFEDASVGKFKKVNITSLTLGGDDKNNYVIDEENSQTYIEAPITEREVTLTWSNTTFSYDKKSHVPTVTLGNKIDGDEVMATVSGAAINVKADYEAEVIELTGKSASNYKLPEETTCTFAINKGEPDYTVPEFDNISCDTKLNDLELGDGFTLENGNEELVAGTTNKIKLKYTPEDTVNYEVVENIVANVMVVDHTWGEVTEITAPTCTAKGEGLHTCTVCETQESVDIDALRHKYGQPEYEWSKDGKSCKAIAICTREKCDHKDDYKVEEDGKVTAKVTKISTCIEKGTTTYTAKFDNAMFNDQEKEVETEDIDALNHDWGEWKVTTPATQTSKGIETRICKRDSSHIETREIPELDASQDDSNKNSDDPNKNSDDPNKNTDDPNKDNKTPVTKTTSLSKKKVVLSKSSFTYNNKVQKPTVKSIGGKKLELGTDYTIKYSNKSSKNVGSYKVTITGKGKYTGKVTATYKIVKAVNPMKVSAKSVNVKYSNIKNKTKSLKKSAVFKFKKNGQGKISFKKVKGNKKITVTNKGVIKIKKGLKKGSYKVTVKVTAAGNKNYKKLSKNVKVTIKVK